MQKIDDLPSVPESDHEGWVCWGYYGNNAGFFENCDELRDWCARNSVDPPSRVLACYERGIQIDAEQIVEDALVNGEHHESAGDDISRAALARLQAFLDAWCDGTGARSWFPDDGKAVVLDPTKWDAMIAKGDR